MNHNKNRFGWLFTATIMILVVSLAACQSTKPTATAKSKPATDTPSVAVVTPTESPTTAPTAEPIILPGAITTASGLQYLELITGDGTSPKVGDIITMQYAATLPDGTVLFDTHTQNQPVTTVWGRGRLLPGWEEGIGLMKVGGKAEIVLPPELAFGAQGYGSVPPNSQVIMVVELLAVKSPPSPTSVSADKLQKTASGLQYYDIALGDGTQAITDSIVTTNYTLWVKGDNTDTYIDSSESGTAITFVVGRGDKVFPGWEEGVTGMKVGGKRLLIIPPTLGMGDQSSGEIPANATLVLEIELTKVSEPQKATPVDEKDYVTTASGLKYYDIQVGTGETPVVGQTVEVNYIGWLEDGTQFDSSYDRGQTFTFQLGMSNVIPGWDEGIATMKVGGKRQLVIPPALGYGDTGAGSTIPPGATLIFEVELVAIQP